MGWTPAQRRRLAREKAVLEKFFPGCVTWIDPTGDTKVEVALKTNNGNRYRLRIYLKKQGGESSDFPNSVPDMVVSASPRPMPNWGSSSKTHTLGHRDGFLLICHYHPSKWTDQSSLYEVILKGRVWIEAYESHLATKMAMSSFLPEMK